MDKIILKKNYYGTLLFNKSVYLIHQCIFPGMSNWQSEFLRLCWLTLRWFWILSPTLRPFFVTCHALQYFLPVMSNCSSLNSVANKHSNDFTFVSLNTTLRYIRPKVKYRISFSFCSITVIITIDQLCALILRIRLSRKLSLSPFFTSWCHESYCLEWSH